MSRAGNTHEGNLMCIQYLVVNIGRRDLGNLGVIGSVVLQLTGEI
jgi:hypothetical protein